MDLRKVIKYFYPYTILDIGANVGQFHTLAKQHFPDSYIFSIEADSSCEEELKKVTQNYIITLLAKDNNIYDFYTIKSHKHNSGNSIYKELTEFYNDDNIVIEKKSGVKLDNLFDDDIPFDLIKIDTQGSELDILSGGVNICKKAKGILVEVSLIPYNENAPLYDDVMNFMNTIGFKAMDEIGYGYHPLNGNLIQKDILFINNRV